MQKTQGYNAIALLLNVASTHSVVFFPLKEEGVGLHPTSLQALYLPSFKTEERRPGVSNRDINGLMDGGPYMSEARSWGSTPSCALHGGQDTMEVSVPKGKGRLSVIGGIDVRWAH